jgi:hypothetical protein
VSDRKLLEEVMRTAPDRRRLFAYHKAVVPVAAAAQVAFSEL